MKVLRCYNCGSEERSFYADENGFSLVKCGRCGLLYVEERPDDKEISQAAKQGTHSGLRQLDVTGVFKESKIASYSKVLDDIYSKDCGNKKTLLDVGCGHGEFMIAYQNYFNGNVLVRGTEPNEVKRNSALRRGLNVGYFDLESHNDRYDTISLLNVYSHLPEPPAFLAMLKCLLNPGGELILETGDTANLPLKNQYTPFNLPDHLSFASEDIVTDILKRLGFEIISVNKYPHSTYGMLLNNPKSIAKEFIKIFLPRYKSKIPDFFNYNRNHVRKCNLKIDMYIRAKVKS